MKLELLIRNAITAITVCSVLCVTICSTQEYCTRSSDPSLTHRRRLEAVKQAILLRLGLREAPANPDPRNISEIDPKVLADYRAAKRAQEKEKKKEPCTQLDFHDKILLHYFPSEPVQNFAPDMHSDVGSVSGKPIYDRHRIKFSLDLQGKDYITDAELRLTTVLRDSYGHPSTENQTVRSAHADRVEIAILTPVDGNILHIPVTGGFIDPQNLDRITRFNVTRAMNVLLDEHLLGNDLRGEIELEVYIRCPEALKSGIEFRPSVQFVTNDTRATQLIITTYQSNGVEKRETNKPEVRRRRQSYTNDYEFCRPKQFQCCLNEMYVDFRNDLNWTWIREPRNISFNYCNGGCPIGYRSGQSTRHAFFIDILRRNAKNNPTAAPEPCCVPDSFEPIRVIIDIQGDFSLMTFDELYTTSCACK